MAARSGRRRPLPGGAQVQGSGAWQGLGLLWDAAGADGYDADALAQGWAAHLGAGALVDLAGDDRYQLALRGQGAAADRAVAWLWEGGGDDRFGAGAQAQAWSQGQALALLLEMAGDDLLVGDPARRGPSPTPDPTAAAFVDLGGAARRVEAPLAGEAPALPREADRAALPKDEALRQHLLALLAGLPASADPLAAERLRDEALFAAVDQGRLHASPAVRRAAWALATERQRRARVVPGAGLPRILGATWAEAAAAAVAAAGPDAAPAAAFLAAADQGEAITTLVALMASGSFEQRRAAEGALAELAAAGHSALIRRAAATLARPGDDPAWPDPSVQAAARRLTMVGRR